MGLSIGIVPVTPLQQNCALIFDDETKRGAVFDPGGDVDAIIAGVEKGGVTVEAIYLTHGHVDHAAGADECRDRLTERQGERVPIVGPHKGDESFLLRMAEQARMYGIAGARNVVPDRWLEGGEVETIAGLPFEVSHTPGHAPGHVVFHQRDLGFAHVGDVLFAGSIGRVDLPGSDPDAMMRSIRDVCLTWSDKTQFICGHGPGSTIGRERQSNPFLQGL